MLIAIDTISYPPNLSYGYYSVFSTNIDTITYPYLFWAVLIFKSNKSMHTPNIEETIHHTGRFVVTI